MSNSEAVLKELSRKCDGKHKHEPLLDGRAKAAAIYPEGLCRAICKGLMEQLRMDKAQVKSLLKVGMETMSEIAQRWRHMMKR